MHDSKVFSTIDLREAYDQIELSEEDKILQRLSPRKDFIVITDFVLVYQMLVTFVNAP